MKIHKQNKTSSKQQRTAGTGAIAKKKASKAAHSREMHNLAMKQRKAKERGYWEKDDK